MRKSQSTAYGNSHPGLMRNIPRFTTPPCQTTVVNGTVPPGAIVMKLRFVPNAPPVEVYAGHCAIIHYIAVVLSDHRRRKKSPRMTWVIQRPIGTIFDVE